jgi:hypothetical protein
MGSCKHPPVAASSRLNSLVTASWSCMAIFFRVAFYCSQRATFSRTIFPFLKSSTHSACFRRGGQKLLTEPGEMQSGLVFAYRSTDYVAYTDSRAFLIRIGHHSLAIDGLLTKMKAKSGVFITAWNPFSKIRSAGANAYWDRQLKVYMSARGFAYFAGEGRGKTGEWPPESSILAFGMSRAQAASMGRRFRQNAVVYVPLGRPAELVMLRWLG